MEQIQSSAHIENADCRSLDAGGDSDARMNLVIILLNN